ncbi:hypothetical protein BO86DRAFT_380918 [Aspergillus japonicus CBS 114.51]|uniref:Uncharacterized protein n=1 Tax=Aspergillus japonicus CBS 114.51 TaxID=1448312 RepID=A0A8T8WVR6_ASPJA|nr:hypothetical protein BO86DRAFT_380918 [Aspergillus japonicus CBS 114.51]RAH79926.1 hypothetical protein BO86DRAFT_380918 [Aspergillus japonicus CBS 114.51]
MGKEGVAADGRSFLEKVLPGDRKAVSAVCWSGEWMMVVKAVHFQVQISTSRLETQCSQPDRLLDGITSIPLRGVGEELSSMERESSLIIGVTEGWLVLWLVASCFLRRVPRNPRNPLTATSSFFFFPQQPSQHEASFVAQNLAVSLMTP